MEAKQLDAAFNVAETMLTEAAKINETAYVSASVGLLVLAAFVIATAVYVWNVRSERKLTEKATEKSDNLQLKLNEQIAASHDKMAEAVCRMADSDARAVECQQAIQLQVAKLREEHLTVFGVADEALAIAEEYAPSDSIRAGATRLRRRLEKHKD